jgi:hypothetical protein
MNGHNLFGPVHPAQAVLMDEDNYSPNMGTPLYSQGVVTLLEVEAEVARLERDFSVYSILFLMTDGGNTGAGSPEQVRQIVERLLAAGNHIIAGIGVDDGQTDFRAVFRSMGIPENMIDVWSREEGDIVEGMRHTAHTASLVGDPATFGHTSRTGFSRVPPPAPAPATKAPAAPWTPPPVVQPEAPTRRAGVNDLAGMLEPAAVPVAPANASAPEIKWGPVDTSATAALKFVPELGQYVLQFPKGIDTMIVGRHEPSRGLKDKGVFFVEVTDPNGMVSRRHIKIERVEWYNRALLAIQSLPRDYRITILDKLNPEDALFVAVDGQFIQGTSQIVRAGSEISLSPDVKFRLGLPGGI